MTGPQEIHFFGKAAGGSSSHFTDYSHQLVANTLGCKLAARSGLANPGYELKLLAQPSGEFALDISSVPVAIRPSLSVHRVVLFNQFHPYPGAVMYAPVPHSVRLPCLTNTIRLLGTFYGKHYQPEASENHYWLTLLKNDEGTEVQALLPSEVFTQNDVCFVFPRNRSSNPYLWANTKALVAASSFWRSMFETAEMEESTNLLPGESNLDSAYRAELKKVLADARKTVEPVDDIMVDSDAEGEAGAVEAGSDATASDTAVIRYVVVKDVPRQTYKAVLDYISTGKISFATLSSTRGSKVEDLPSPKSIYRFAHEFDLDSLRKLALADFTGQLGAANVLQELFSPTCYFYDELQEAALTVAVRKWQGIRGSEIFEKIMEKVESGSTDSKEAAAVALKLLKRV